MSQLRFRSRDLAISSRVSRVVSAVRKLRLTVDMNTPYHDVFTNSRTGLAGHLGLQHCARVVEVWNDEPADRNQLTRPGQNSDNGRARGDHERRGAELPALPNLRFDRRADTFSRKLRQQFCAGH